jgi:spermidine synthase
VGVIGLGAGALAASVGPGQALRFYELDPEVAAIGRDPAWFTFLATSGGSIDVVPGDGRLSLAREPDGRFDLIVADAFSSDAVPVHLLTREAIELYMKKLAPSGALVFNTSNRHVDLEAIVVAAARALRLAVRVCAPPRDAAAVHGTWAAVARDPAGLAPWLERAGEWTDPPARAGAAVAADAVWTDDHASLLAYIRW